MREFIRVIAGPLLCDTLIFFSVIFICCLLIQEVYHAVGVGVKLLLEVSDELSGYSVPW